VGGFFFFFFLGLGWFLSERVKFPLFWTAFAIAPSFSRPRSPFSSRAISKLLGRASWWRRPVPSLSSFLPSCEPRMRSFSSLFPSATSPDSPLFLLGKKKKALQFLIFSCRGVGGGRAERDREAPPFSFEVIARLFRSLAAFSKP